MPLRLTVYSEHLLRDPVDVVPFGAYAVGTGPFVPVYANSSAHSSNNATTPKIGLSYQLDDNNMVYATAAKGFRPAGAFRSRTRLWAGGLRARTSHCS